MVIIRCGCHWPVHGGDFPCAESKIREQLSFPVVVVVKRGKWGRQGGEGV